MTSSPVYFTVEADFKAFVADTIADNDSNPDIVPLTGVVTFRPLVNDGDMILATDASPRPTGFLAAPVVATITSTGQLRMRSDGTPVRLLADSPLLELNSPLFYSVSFSNIRYQDKTANITGFNFQAPNSDTTINLITLARQPGVPASGITKIAPGAVRAVDGELVFSFGGVDIPDPVPITLGIGDLADSTTVGVNVVTAATKADARSAIDAEYTGNKGAAGGYAPLNSSSQIDAQYLPSFVDDVLEYANQAGFPEAGSTGKIYVALDNGDAFRWSGSAYVRISDRITASGITDSTSVGRSVLTASDQAAARSAIGAGTSSLTIGTTSSTAKVGDYQPASTDITDSTSVGRSVLTASDQAAARSAIGAGTSNLTLGTTNSTAKVGDYQPASTDITDSTSVGRSVLTASDQAAARSAIGAGTSSLTIGTTSSTAKAGDYTPTSTEITTALGFTPEDASKKNQANGFAGLNSTGLIEAAQLPSYVDDVVEYANAAAFPGTGEAAKIYIALDTGRSWRWSGSTYVEIIASPGTTDNVTEGSTNLYYTAARADGRISAAIGVTVQAYDADLTAFAAKTAPTGAVVGTTDTQTLTGKTISGADNTLSNIAQSAVTSLTTDLAGKESTANKDAANGYIGADSSGKLPVSKINASGTASSGYFLRGDGSWSVPAGAGDLSSNTNTSVDSEVALFDGTSGKSIKRATASGIAKLTSGVLSAVTAPSGTIVGTTDSQALTNKDLTGSGNTFPAFVASETHAATSKTTPVDADELPLVDTAASNVLKRLTWSNLKATIKAYYDDVASTLTNKSISGSSNTLSNIPLTALSASTTTAVGVGSVELGHASDTSLTRSAAGKLAVEGVDVLLNGGALGTPASGTLTNCGSLPISGLTSSTSTAVGVGSIELGHASDTTLARSAAGQITVEGKAVLTEDNTVTVTNKTLTNPTVNNYTEGVVAIGTVTSSHTISLTSGTVQTATLTASTACTFTMPTATAGKSFTLLLKQAASTGNGTATFTSVKWGTAGAPTITAAAGKMDILSFFSDGTNWYGSVAQGYTP